MLRTFKALLKNGRLEWLEDNPELGEEAREVYVTLLDTTTVKSPKTRGQKMAQILDTLANTGELDNIDPKLWQEETRSDRSLPGR